MIIHIIKNIKLDKYLYTVNEYSDYYAESNYDYALLPRKIKASAEHTYVLHQTMWVLKSVTLLPIFWIFHTDSFPRYKIFQDGNLIGKTCISFFSPRRKFIANAHLYELYLHSNNIVSVMKDNIQVAIIKKDIKSFNEQGYYMIEYDENNIELGLLMLLVAYTDVAFFNSHFRFDSVKYEKTVTVGKDKFFDRTLWHPKARDN